MQIHLILHVCADAHIRKLLEQDVCVLCSGPPPTLAVACLSHSGHSYADRVKCSQALPMPNQSTSVPTEKPGQLQIYKLHTFGTKITSLLVHFVLQNDLSTFLVNCGFLWWVSHYVLLLDLLYLHVWCFSPGKKDAEGWETVQRGRSLKPRAIAMVAKVSPVLAHVSPKDASDKQNQQLQDKAQRPEEQQGDNQLISPEQNSECEKASVLEVVTSTHSPYPSIIQEQKEELRAL